MEEGIIHCNMDLAMMLWKNNVKRLLKVHDYHRSESFANNSKDTLLRRIRTQGLFFQKSRTSCKNLATREINAVDSPLKQKTGSKTCGRFSVKDICDPGSHLEENIQGSIKAQKQDSLHIEGKYRRKTTRMHNDPKREVEASFSHVFWSPQNRNCPRQQGIPSTFDHYLKLMFQEK
ncbi:hypothetical protein COP1_022478 [Malus domestica]